MKLLSHEKDPANITVKSTLDGQGATAGLFIQVCLLFALFYMIKFSFSSDNQTIAIFMLLLVTLLNLCAYYFMIHAPITRNLNQVHISKKGITQTYFYRQKRIQAAEIVKAILYYTYIKGSRGSESTYLVELVADLKNKKPVTLFYMEKVYWKDEYDKIHNAIIDTLIACNYCTHDDYQDSIQ